MLQSAHRIMLFAATFMLAANAARAAVTLDNLQVEYAATPIGIDVEKPRFSWQMHTSANEHGIAQGAYQLQVADPSGAIVWNSGKISDSRALAVIYAGTPLKPTTRYTWKVTAWDQSNTPIIAASWFETGLMNPALAAWEGATFIGSNDLPLFSQYLSIYAIKYTLAIPEGSTKASFIFGANDPRLMNKYKNIYQLESPHNASYLKLELDLSPVTQTPSAPARLNLYRAGYAPTDNPARPLRTFQLPAITPENLHKEHRFALRVELGNLNLTIDDAVPAPFDSATTAPARGGRGRGGAIPINPLGTGGDFITLGMLCDIGFALDPHQSATFTNLEITNVRSPGDTLFDGGLSGTTYTGIFKEAERNNTSIMIANNGYQLMGGEKGLFLTANPSRNSMPMLRSRFTLANKPIKDARLYATARGIYELALNGQRVGDDYYNPGLTQYNKTHLYQTYDVTKLLNPGNNALGAMLGEGWWSGLITFGAEWNHFGDRQSLLAKLVITYEDGTRQFLTTNPRDWKVFTEGPIRTSSLFMGEVYDATRDPVIEGWSTATYDDHAWKPAAEIPLEGTTFSGAALSFDKLELLGQIGPTAKIYKTLKAKSVKEVRPHVYLYDLGQNIVGVPRITLASGTAGRQLTLRYSEMLYPDLAASRDNVGMIMTENYRAALSQDLYTQRAGPQAFQPRFTSHGFQYIEITGLDAPLPTDAVEGIAISSIHALTADYECSNPKVNQLWSNIVWSNIDNFLSIPTDCPQRNERMGWSGDISVFSRTATYLSNADGFLRRHLRAMRDVQTPAGRFTDVAPIGGGFGGILWGSAGITIPWECYQQYGDLALLEEHYPAMAAYMNYIATTINPTTGLISDAQLGDWLGPQNNQLNSQFLAAAYHIFDLDIMTNVAEALGKKEDAAKWRTMRDDRKAFFNKAFVNADNKVITPAGGGRGRGAATASAPASRLSDVQSAYAVGLALNAFNDNLRDIMAQNLAATVDRENKDDANATRAKYSLMTGFIGTAWISKALSDAGRDDLAYRQLQTTTYPSWLYSIDQGATTIWERLNGYTVENGFGGNNGMNSFNHYSFGAVGQWLIAYSLGIQRDQPGFHHFILQPHPDPTGQMTWARGHYDSAYGRIESSWKIDGDHVAYTVTVPPNTSALLLLPSNSPVTRRELSSGTYTFTAPR